MYNIPIVVYSIENDEQVSSLFQKLEDLILVVFENEELYVTEDDEYVMKTTEEIIELVEEHTFLDVYTFFEGNIESYWIEKQMVY